MTRPHWSTLRVADPDVRGRSLAGPARLAALYHWYTGKTSIAVISSQGPRTNPRAIDWTDFPAHEVIAAQLAPAEQAPEDAPAEQAPPARRRNVLRSRSTLRDEGQGEAT
jgi:hypothetical protein